MHSSEKWMEKAACRSSNVNLFYPENQGGNKPRGYDPIEDPRNVTEIQNLTIRNFCNSCRARKDCLNFALENHEMFGVWGGLNQEQLRMLHKKNGYKKPKNIIAS